jgi:hypothetical protein
VLAATEKKTLTEKHTQAKKNINVIKCARCG